MCLEPSSVNTKPENTSSQASFFGVRVRLEEVGSKRITFELVRGTLERVAQEA